MNTLLEEFMDMDNQYQVKRHTMETECLRIGKIIGMIPKSLLHLDEIEVYPKEEYVLCHFRQWEDVMSASIPLMYFEVEDVAGAFKKHKAEELEKCKQFKKEQAIKRKEETAKFKYNQYLKLKKEFEKKRKPNT